MHAMVIQFLCANRQKSSRANMKRDAADVYITLGKSAKNLFCKMQSCRRRGDGSRFVCKHGLVTVFVLLMILAADIGRQRHMTDTLKRFKKIVGRGKTDQAVTVFNSFNDFTVDARREIKPGANPDRL